MCPGTGVSFSSWCSGSRGSGSVTRSPEGQAGDTAQVRLSALLHPVSSSISRDTQGARLGWVLCPELCAHPTCACIPNNPIPEAAAAATTAPGQAGAAMPMQSHDASNFFYRQSQREAGKGHRGQLWLHGVKSCTCLGWATPESQQDHLLNPGLSFKVIRYFWQYLVGLLGFWIHTPTFSSAKPALAPSTEPDPAGTSTWPEFPAKAKKWGVRRIMVNRLQWSTGRRVKTLISAVWVS